MSQTQKLKLFCDRYKLDFPSFEFYNLENGIGCKIFWYGEEICISNIFLDKDSCIVDALINLDNWTNKEENFLKIVLNDIVKYSRGRTGDYDMT